MVLSGFHKWMGLFVAIFVATALLCTPADAKSNSSSKESHKTSSKTTKKEKSAKKKNAKKSKKVKINEDDPKAFTKALLADKEGVEYEIVESKKKKNARKKKAERAQDIGETFDFSTMLLPITHEALVGSPYGIRSHRLHRGVDVSIIRDEPVVAAFPGKVVVSKYNRRGYGH